MKVVICGAGQVGYGIAEKLSGEQIDVSVIDISPELVRRVRDALDVRGIVGHGAHPHVLEEAGIDGADMIIAVTHSDEVNMVACEVAHSLFNVPTKIARIREQSYLKPIYGDLFAEDNMAIDVVISPEVEVGEMVVRRIALPGATDVLRFAEGQIYMVAIECRDECPIINTPLSQLSELFPDLGSTVVGVMRDGVMFVPKSADQLRAGDLAYVASTQSQVRRTLGLFGHEETEATRIVIAGGGSIALYTAMALEKRKLRTAVKLIENNRQRATEVADRLDHTVVLHGSCLDQKILLEAGVQDADLLVALTNDDQVNILSSVMAKRLGCRSNLALINDPTYHTFVGSLSIDAYVNPRMVTISRVLQHVRRGRIRAVQSVQNGAAEIIEAEALETSPLVGPTLREAKLPPGIRIGAVYRGGKVIQPDGELRIRPQDRVVIFALAESVRKAEHLFRVSLDFF